MMPRLAPAGRACLVLLLAVGSVCITVAAEGAPPSPATLQKRIADLEAKLRDDLMNEKAARDLAKLREKADRLRRDAMGRLASGLDAYLGGAYARAAADLAAAAQHPSVVSMADEGLPHPLRKLAADATRRGGKAANAACRVCGGAGETPCKSCNGAGVEPCPDCDGDGMKDRTVQRRKIEVVCKTCKGKGFLVCEDCGGDGWTPCPRCGGGSDAEEADIPERAREAIRKVIARARYLQGGGVDVESSKALNPTDKPLRTP